MNLSKYHQKYINYPDSEILNRALEKRKELVKIFNRVKLRTKGNLVKIAVLGCGDKRFVRHHEKIFKEFITKPVEITTFDITINHLKGAKNIIKYDCTLPLPKMSFDIVYVHVLLKFIETEKQWHLIKNSYETLKPGGFAIHIIDKEDYEIKEKLLSNGQFTVPLDRWRGQLDKMGVKYEEILVKYGLAFIILKN